MIWSSPPSLITNTGLVTSATIFYWQDSKSGLTIVDVWCWYQSYHCWSWYQPALWVSQKSLWERFYFSVKSCLPVHSYSRWFYFDCKNFIWLENNSSVEGPAVPSAKISSRFSWELTLAIHPSPTTHTILTIWETCIRNYQTVFMQLKNKLSHRLFT